MQAFLWVLLFASKSLSSPTAKTLNGTYVGLHNSTTGIDYFLGIPYAQAPVKDLRFRNPVSLNSSWDGLKKAQSIGNSCVGYGSDSAGLVLDEVKPADS